MTSELKPPVITIDIDILEAPGDDGSVICTQSESCCWIFSTVTAPFYPATEDGYHPVSGNRQFGYIVHPNGSMKIFTKGTDRFYAPLGGIFPLITYISEMGAFQGADWLWESMQEGIKAFVEDPISGLGSATINPPVKFRPKVGIQLMELLIQETPITFIPCGN